MKAERFPYHEAPFSSRAWGSPFHSLCSYQGKLKPAVAHWLIEEFTSVGDTVLDPLGGVGTVALEAAMQARNSYTNDKNPLAAIVAAAKVDPPTLSSFVDFAEKTSEAIERESLEACDFAEAEFGLNGAVKSYYHEATLLQVLKARKLFLRDEQKLKAPNAFYWASALHVLHGNRPYALSRTSHSLTPLAPSGPFLYRDFNVAVLNRGRRLLNMPLPELFHKGKGYWGDFRNLPTVMPELADAIITSPPFPGLRFDRPNWLRLWFCGWTAHDFLNTSLDFLERQQTKSLDIYDDLFATCRELSKKSSRLILHVGSGAKDARTFIDGLKESAFAAGYDFQREYTDVLSGQHHHGLLDKGKRNTSHHFVVFRGN